jgi:hypothetical protein
MGDRRLWLGLALVAVAALVGAFLLRDGRTTVPVLRAPRDLSAGASIDAADTYAIDADLAAGYARPGDTGTLRWPVGAGQLIPATAVVSSAAPVPMRRVTLAVDPLHAPVGLAPGDRVDLWATVASAGAGASPPPEVVLAGVAVSEVASDETGMSGQVAVVLDVPVAQVGAVVAAGRSGVVDLTAVPIDQQDSL